MYKFTSINNTSLLNDANIVSYLRCEDNLTDAKGNKTFTGSGTIKYRDGSLGKAFYCDGVGYARSNSACMEWNADATITFLMKLDTYTSGQYFGRYSNSAGKWVYYFSVGSNGEASFRCVKSDYNADVVTSSNNTILTGEEYRVVCVRRSNYLYLYINGNSVGTPVAVSGTYNTGDVETIGTNNYNQSPIVDGSFDDIAFFNRALTESEIKSLSSQVLTLGEYLGAGSGTTKLLLHLNGNSTDSSGNGNNGTDSNITYSQANGKFGQGAGFNSSFTSYITLPSQQTITTLSFWCNIVSISVSTSGKSLFFSASPANAINAAITPNSDKILLYDGTNRVGTNTWVKNQWANYVFVYTTSGGNGYNIYLNGKFLEKIACNQLQVRYIGRNNPSGTSFNGAMDEVIIENRAWSAEEVKKYYTMTKGSYATL